jgi:hypothetical protein
MNVGTNERMNSLSGRMPSWSLHLYHVCLFPPAIAIATHFQPPWTILSSQNVRCSYSVRNRNRPRTRCPKQRQKVNASGRASSTVGPSPGWSTLKRRAMDWHATIACTANPVTVHFCNMPIRSHQHQMPVGNLIWWGFHAC